MQNFHHLGTKRTLYSSGKVRFPIADRRRHMLVSGRPGTGKSTLLANIFAQIANSGNGGALLIDPHGELAEQAVSLVPPRMIRKVIYLNPTDLEWPIGFNVLDSVPVDQRPTRAAVIVSAFKSIWGDSWGPRLEHILYNTLAALLDMPGSTLLCIPHMLLSSSFRAKVLGHVLNPVVANFWRQEFPAYEKKFGIEATSPVLNKIGALIASPAMRNILGQTKSAFDCRHVMDNNYLVIVNLAKGQLGDQHAALLGALLISCFGAAALSRSDTPEAERRDFAMIVDEFHNYATTAFSSLLAEARKYRLSLILAHQYLEQMSPEIRAAVLGNVGSVVAFRLGAQDTATFARELYPATEHQLTETENHHAWCRLLQHGTPCEPFILNTPEPPRQHGHDEKIIRHSRIHYATERAKIEAKITRFFQPLTSGKKTADW